MPVLASGKRMHKSWWPPSSAALILVGLTMIGLALRLPSFNDSLYGDELSTNYVVNGFGIGSVLHIVLSDQEGTPPLFFFLTWLTKGFDGVEGLRVISFLAGIASIPITYLLGVRTVGRAAGMVGATLLALSPFQIFYATEARAYELMMFFCLLAALSLVIALDTGRTRWWVAYSLSVAGAAYSHYTSVFVLIGLFGWALIARPEARRWVLLANAGAVVLYLPWVPELINDRNEPAAKAIELLHPLTLHGAENDVVHWSIGHPYIPIAQLPGDWAVWAMAAGALLGIIGIVLKWRQGEAGEPLPHRSGIGLVLVLAFAAPVGAVLDHLVGPSVFSSRNIISSWPGLALAAGALVTAGAAPWRIAATSLLIVGFAIGGLKMLNTDHQRPDYAGAVGFVEQRGGPSAPVVDSAGGFTPGAQTAIEAAFAPKGQAAPRDRKVLTLGFPTLSARLQVRREGKSIIAPLPTPTGAQIAQQAVRAAGSGPIFLVTGGAPLAELRRYQSPLADFLKALPGRFHEAGSRSFPGLGYTGFLVYVLSAAPADRAPSG